MIDYSKIYSTKSLDGEIWKDIEGYEGIYQVSNFGRVKSLERYIYNNLINSEVLLKERVLHVGKGVKGRYFRVKLSKNGSSKSMLIHRLVAEAFIPNLLNKPQVDHINANRFDNRVENLRWVTSKENCNNPLRLELFTGSNNHYYGKKHSVEIRHKMSVSSTKRKQVINITTGELFISIRKAAEKYGSSHSQIKNVIQCNKKYKGCYWRFYEG